MGMEYLNNLEKIRDLIASDTAPVCFQNTIEPPSELTFDEYQGYTSETAVYPGKKEIMGLMYCGLGAAGEAGEVANKIKKVLRDNYCILDEAFKKKISKEMGGVLWYLAQLAEEMGTTLGAIARDNVMELRGRRERGTLHGDGDDR